MINWQETINLHAIVCVEALLKRWFNVEVLYVDASNNIHGKVLDPDYAYGSLFFKMQMALPHGRDYLEQDLEQIQSKLKTSSDKLVIQDSFISGIKMAAAPIVQEGEYLGCIVAYPYVASSITSAEIQIITEKMAACFNQDPQDQVLAIEHLKRMRTTEGDHFQELLKLVSEEVVAFHREIREREERIHMLNTELGDKFRFHNMVGKSRKMQQIYALLEKIAHSDSSVFIQGDNGTGKELVAKAIHFSSLRKDRVFLAVNCSAFNDNLLDSELFGHVKGSFTGAIKDKKGLFEQANGGTLFLDEIGDTSLSMQVKLLRVLQEGTYLPVGSTQPRSTDVRIICATNKNVKEMMARGEFREDLFYRLNVINVQLPPLRERAEDIPLLVDFFLQKKCGESGKPLKIISQKCMEKLLDYRWPGNIRELENEIERLVVLSGEEKTIMPDLLSPKISEALPVMAGGYKGINTSGTLKTAMEELEAFMIGEGLKRCNYNKSRLAKELGISRASLIMTVEKYNLDKRRQLMSDNNEGTESDHHEDAEKSA